MSTETSPHFVQPYGLVLTMWLSRAQLGRFERAHYIIELKYVLFQASLVQPSIHWYVSYWQSYSDILLIYIIYISIYLSCCYKINNIWLICQTVFNGFSKINAFQQFKATLMQFSIHWYILYWRIYSLLLEINSTQLFLSLVHTRLGPNSTLTTWPLVMSRVPWTQQVLLVKYI